ncbi:MAG TPA: nucleotidyltransferase family protein, partial [Chthoniobacterales bacterium]|nr:nucleotidyltransferase family protein [Chthoniobacterales bacterium]
MQTNINKAVLLAAGRGTRMRDLTEALPKPMLEVRGKPVLQHIVEGLRENGLTNLLVVVGWRAEVVKEFFGDGSKLDVNMQYETQTVQDGTGRVLALAENFAGGDPFLLSYGDILIAPENYRRIRDA